MIRRSFVTFWIVSLIVVAAALPPMASSPAPVAAAPEKANRLQAYLANQPGPTCPNNEDTFLFPPRNVTIPAVPPWGFPAFTGNPALEPLPNGFSVVERPAWFDGIPITIRPFPRPSVGNGGPDDNHADMYVFFYPDGTPVPQSPLLEAVPKNAAGPGVVIPDIAAQLFSANWEVQPVRVTQDYVPGTIKSLEDLANPAWVLEVLQTNVFVLFPVVPPGTLIPDLNLNGLTVRPGTFQGNTVFFVEYDVWDNEYSKKPAYLFRKQTTGEFVGDPVVSAIPGMPHYNSLWNVFIVDVPDSYVANTLKSEDAVLASGFPTRFAFDAFFPVDAVDGMRTVFPNFRNIISGPDGRFQKENLPKTAPSITQPYHSDLRINPATIGFVSNFSINEVEIPRLIEAAADVEVPNLLLVALRGQIPNLCQKVILPPHVARQRIIEDANGNLMHLSHSEAGAVGKTVDSMSLAELVIRGQAIFEREFTEAEGVGPAVSAFSCATCHGQPFFIGVEPLAGGGGVRFRNGIQATDTTNVNNPPFKVKRSRNTPHLFGLGILTQLGKQRHPESPPVVTDNNPWPHNWKGSVANLRPFTGNAARNVMGLEPVEILATVKGVPLAQAATLDGDNDGVVAELTVGDVTALAAFQASLPRPVQINQSDPKVIHGRQVFETVGCAFCHTPVQTLQSTVWELPNPENANKVRIPLGSPTVELYSDLKRHKMGALLAEPGPQAGIPADVFKTKELWGLADSGPWLHDGSANTIEEAIVKHGGTGADPLALTAVTNFNALSAQDKADLLSFLNSLKLPRRSELELAFFNNLMSIFNTLPADQKARLQPFLGSFVRIVDEKPLLLAWIVSPASAGTKIRGTVTFQVSITAEAGTAQASLVVDNTTVLPLSYNAATGFHEAPLNTAPLSEGDHLFSLDVTDKAGNRLAGLTSVFFTVDNILDTSPLNWPSNWSGQPKDCVCIGNGLVAG